MLACSMRIDCECALIAACRLDVIQRSKKRGGDKIKLGKQNNKVDKKAQMKGTK